MKLYDLDLSGNCYKVRLFASLIHLDLEINPVNFLEGEHKVEPLLTLNPFGELPIFIDGEIILSEPTRVFRRQFILSHATLADSSNWR